ncbi:MAG: ADP-ribosylation factor-like protein [Candidatus Heimdallarchaeota archaeon]
MPFLHNNVLIGKGRFEVNTTKTKICFLGLSSVGKSSLLSLLQGRKISRLVDPTVGLEIEDSVLNGSKTSIWDFGGQDRFRFMWRDFLRGAGLAVLVCDSTKNNVEKTKEICEKYSRFIGSKIIAIANKQDLPGALSAEEVEKKLGVPTYGMSAIRLDLRGRIRRILEYEVDSMK